MSRSKNFAAALLLSLLSGYLMVGGITSANAEDAPATQAAPDPLRPEVLGPIKEAQDLTEAKKYPEAMAKLDAIKVENPTAGESYAIDITRLKVASLTSNDAVMLETLPRVLASGKLKPAEQLNLTGALADKLFHKGDYAEAANWAQRYFKEGGKDPQMHNLLIHAYYLSNDFAHASTELNADIAAEESAGVAPTKNQLDILVSIAVKQDNKDAIVAAMEKYLAVLPRKDYWENLLNIVHQRPNFSKRLVLDLYRLKLSLGIVKTSGEFLDLADEALRAGYSAEAKKVLEAGHAAGVLKDGGEYEKSMAKATKSAADDMKTLAQTESEVKKNKDGLGLVNVGYTYVINDQFEKGLALMEQGLNSPNIKRPDEAKLHMATAYVLAGRNEEAIKAFNSVHGSDGTADLAHYWVLHLTHPIP